MGKTYRKENQYKKAREGAGKKKPEHDVERTDTRRRLRDTVDRWSGHDDDPYEFPFDEGGG